MTFRLSAAAARQYRLESYDVVGSTNAMALERAQEGDPGQLWIAALRQETGRGRRGRAWATPYGNLAATLLKVLPGSASHAATLGFVAGLSLGEALDVVAQGAMMAIGIDGGSSPGARRYELKWPNDVLTGGAKLAGILLESTFLPDGRFAIAIGIGVNVVAHPDGLPYPATSLKAMEVEASAADVFEQLADAWQRNERIWNDGRGLADIRRLWLDRAAGLGSEVAVALEGRVVRGVFETIDKDCRFVIREANGMTTSIAAGDVHFGAVASAGSA
jgi:BirA family biotin operon repressor/biotin-[acetyl-CoA-carboxylase] ligase